MCETTENLTRHHLMKKGSWRKMGLPEAPQPSTVLLCRSCHDLLHGGETVDRRAAHDRLHDALTEAERKVAALKRPELWELREALG